MTGQARSDYPELHADGKAHTSKLPAHMTAARALFSLLMMVSYMQ